MKISITREELIVKYKAEVDRIADEFEWKTHFEPKEICDIIYNIIKRSGTKIKIKPEILFAKYMNVIFDKPKNKWPDEYNERVKIICNIIYDILETI